VQLASDSTGKSLLFKATAAQQIFVNASPFTVEPGSAFTMTMRARVSPASADSGNFALIFLFPPNGVERSDLAPRQTVPIAAAPAIVASAETDADGRYSVALPQPTVAGKFQWQARFAGSSTTWPAFAAESEDEDGDHQGSGDGRGE
jgi:hypothetical protein